MLAGEALVKQRCRLVGTPQLLLVDQVEVVVVALWALHTLRLNHHIDSKLAVIVCVVVFGLAVSQRLPFSAVRFRVADRQQANRVGEVGSPTRGEIFHQRGSAEFIPTDPFGGIYKGF